MAFSDELEGLMANPRDSVKRFLELLEPANDARLEQMAQSAAAQTRRHFGRTMRMYAPIYLSNECVNNCTYCGFSRDNPILRLTLPVADVVKEAKYLYDQGFRNILLVGGEHPKFVSSGYLQECLEALRKFVPSLSLEIGPLGEKEYSEISAHGAEGLVVYQETYHKETYEHLHTAGPKKVFSFRLDCPERAWMGGFRKLGIGALLGLYKWRFDAKALACHLDYLLRHCWTAQLSVSFPRMRPYAGNYQYQPDPELMINDREFVQLMCAMRISFPQVGITMSTRESPEMRDALVPLGITQISAGSHTEPGGYTNSAKNDVHLTVKGRRVELDDKQKCCAGHATEQFKIADDRTPAEVAEMLKSKGFEPVWKDWDQAIFG